MFDYHYDLLTEVYLNKDNPQKLKRRYKNAYNKNNITGGIFNLFFMSEKEMEDELGIAKQEMNLKQMLYTVHKVIEENKLIPNGIQYVYGIEGLDYLEKLEDVEYLYKLGVRSTNIVWNNENKFGGGSKSGLNVGLTFLGQKLIDKLVECGITIDLSHTNEKTFFDITDYLLYLKEKGKKVRVIASHSNAKVLCNVPRNLTDVQLLTIKKLNGIVGVVGVKKFCKAGNEEEVTIDDYFKHIEYIAKIFGGTDKIGIATDDMSYYPTNVEYNKKMNLFGIYNARQILHNGSHTMRTLHKFDETVKNYKNT